VDVPDNKEVVDSCEVHQEEQDIQSQIDEKRSQEGFERFSDRLDEAEQALERGDFKGAQETLDSLETEKRQNQLIGQFVTGLAALTVIGILASVTVWFVYKKKKRERLYSELEEVTEMVEELGEEGIGVERLFTEVKQVNNQLEHENYHAASTTMEQIREEIERKRH